MSGRRGDASVYVGRLSKTVRGRDLEDLFDKYGEILRCEVKYGMEMAFAFIDFKDKRDAEDAIKYEHGRDFFHQNIIVEWAKGSPRYNGSSFRDGGGGMSERGGYRGFNRMDSAECYRCSRRGHFARDCPELWGGGRRSGGGGGGRSRYRSPSPRRRRSRSRSRSRSRRRSRSRSRSKDRRSRSRDHRSKSKSREGSRKRSRSRSGSKAKSRSKSRSREHRSGSRNNEDAAGGDKKASAERSRSRSVEQQKESSPAAPEQQTEEVNGTRSRSRSKSN